MEWSMHNYGQDYCTLGFETKRINHVAGFYGKGKQLIDCNYAPVGPCPKPTTVKEATKLQIEYMRQFEKT